VIGTQVLQVVGLGKRYSSYPSSADRLKTLLGLTSNCDVYWALQDVSFDLQRGQCLGVVGDNGAGKSTLLKLLAGTLQPSVGAVKRNGRLTAILELGAGFHPDFTGRQNLMYGGSFIGLTPADMLHLSDQIIAYSELAHAIDRPVKTYSSGMVVRLAFALVTAVQPEVLIIDEALAVGDQHFQKKCVQRIAEFRQNGCTVLFCSHSLYHVRQLCDSVLWLDHGRVRLMGDTESVLAAYETHVRQQDAESTARALGPALNESEPLATKKDAQALPVSGRHAGLLLAKLIGVECNANPDQPACLCGPHLSVQMQATSASQEAPSFGVMLEQVHGVGIASVASHADGVLPVQVTSAVGDITWQINLTFDHLPLHSGHYVLSFYLFDAAGLVVYDEWKNHISFQWISPSLTPGLVKLPHHWG